MRLFDTHCHLQDDRIFAEADAIVARARSAGIIKMVCCGSSEADWNAVADLSRRFPEIIPAFGIHPWYVMDRSDADLRAIRIVPSRVATTVGRPK